MKEKERKKGKNGERGELIGFENTCSKLKREQKSLLPPLRENRI